MKYLLVAIGWIIIIDATCAFAQDQPHQFLRNANPSNALFECNQHTMNQTACQAGHRCKCEYNAFGDAMRGLPPGYHWQCGLDQGTCMADVPAGTTGHYK